ncbi:MAG TPA: TM2 domain-containing protein [Pirellulales bacterium]
MMSQMRLALNERSQRRRERHVETLEAQASPTLQRQPWLVEVPAAATATLTMASAPTIDHIANLPAAPKRARQSRRVAILLALFLGAFGAHKMYLGQPWKGRFLIGCTVVGLLVTSLLALVDAVELWRTPRNTFDQRFGC